MMAQSALHHISSDTETIGQWNGSSLPPKSSSGNPPVVFPVRWEYLADLLGLHLKPLIHIVLVGEHDSSSMSSGPSYTKFELGLNKNNEDSTSCTVAHQTYGKALLVKRRTEYGRGGKERGNGVGVHLLLPKVAKIY